ncbi:MAG TPA: class I SAM-dependent methyltransferase [Bryobacteraceae bacterium]|nr:class I SAM-dependent methyltransferase [Bryobacteraceae bacterium]
MSARAYDRRDGECAHHMMNPAEFENIASAEDSFWWYRGMHRIALRLLRHTLPAAPARMLEAGCGTGNFALKLAKEFRCPVDVADLASEGLRYARANGLRRLVQADIRALPIASQVYDCVLSLDVLIHLERGTEGAAVAELARVTRRGGYVMIRAAALDALRSRHSAFTHERQRFTKARLMRLARENGLETVRCTYLNSLLLPVALFRFRVWEPLLRKPVDSGVKPVAGWLDAALGSVLGLEGELVGRGLDLPLGQTVMLIARKHS